MFFSCLSGRTSAAPDVIFSPPQPSGNGLGLRYVDSSTKRRQGFFCRCMTSTEQAADTAEAAAIDHYFSSPTENIFVQSGYEHRDTD